ncbi:MAG TPA: NAD-dependent epimerase/dehydratase family protein [Dongiaceae bacterium]|jgi:UDP-glucose 4-epimerase
MRTRSVGGRVAIIGADGFIGRHLSYRLAAMAALDLVLIGRRFEGDVLARLCPRARLQAADMTSLEAPMACADVDTVIDLVGSESPRSLASAGDDEIATIVAAHGAFYDRLGRCDVRHVIALSSGGTVYGPSEASRIPEDHPTRPRSGYGKLKLMVEQALDAAGKEGGFARTILRPGNCYGPGQTVKRRQGLMAEIVRCYQTGEPLKVAGDGSTVRDYVFVDDVVSAIVLAIDRAPGEGERINIGSGRGTSILQLADLFASVTGRRLELAFGPANDFDVPRNVLDIDKAARLLGWRPEVPLEDGIERVLRATG